MTTIISGTFIGAPGSHKFPAGPGLKLTNNTANYTLTSTAIVLGGAGYSFPQNTVYTGSGLGGAGGIGVDLSFGGRLTNFGNIAGGIGGQGVTSASGEGGGGAGGAGIRFAASGTLVNHGSIDGGQGSRGGFGTGNASGAGGLAVDFIGSGRVTNDSEIIGGAGGGYGQSADGGAGGGGIYFAAKSTLTNHGTILGGTGGYGGFPTGNGGDGATGVSLAAGGLILNTAIIAGGSGGSAVNYDNYGFSTGNTARGGDAIDLAKGGIVLNSGSITGGAGGGGEITLELGSTGGNGGNGIYGAAGGIVVNTGHITGGTAGTAGGGPYPSNGFGGVGVLLGDGVLVNFGVIAGGGGGGNGGNGGAGAELFGGTLPDINFGTITGGDANFNSGGEQLGGDGVLLLTTGTFINFGTIAGGAGQYIYGNSNAGIFLAGGSTLLDAGSITAGDGGLGDAVYFSGTGSSRLILDPTAKFGAMVVAAGSDNVLELAGTTLGTLGGGGLGNEFIGFDTLQVDAHASWVVTGNVADLADNGLVSIASGTVLDVTSVVNAASTGIFALTGKASLEIAALLGSHAKIEFLGSTPQNLLTIDAPAKFGLHVGTAAYTGPLLEDFKAGNTIDLKDIGSSGLKFDYSASTGDLQITASGGGVVASLQFQNASLGAGSFHLVTDKAGGSLLTHS